MKTFLRSLAFGASLLTLTAALQAGPVLAGNAGLAGQTLSADDVKAVLLGKKITIGSSRVVLVLIRADAAQDTYLQANAAMNTSQFLNYWRKLFMTGGGTAPKVVETEADARKTAGETAGAVVIVDAAAAGSLPVLAK